MLFSRKEEINPSILAVHEKTGWSVSKTQKKMNRAKELGLSYKAYVRHEAWNLTEDEVISLAEDLARKKAARERAIATVQEAAGWDHEKAGESLKNARKLGISGSQYIRKAAYELESEEELAELGRQLKLAGEKRQENYKIYLDEVCRETGWTPAEAQESMDKAKEMGISYLKYVQNGCWELSEDELLELAEKITRYKTETIAANKAYYVQKIMDAAGWSRGKTELEVLKAKNLTGCSYEDFYVFRFYAISPEEQVKYVTLDLFNKMRIKFNHHSTAAAMFDDKAKFNETFHDFINRRWFVNTDLTFASFVHHTEGLSSVLVKPLCATQGQGIYKLNIRGDEKSLHEAYSRLTAPPEGREDPEDLSPAPSIVEEYIVQHEATMSICPASVNTLRITTLNYNGQCHFLYSVFRMGRGGVVDNFHAGGIAAAVDIETGKVITDAADLSGNTFPVHPVSGITIKGFQIPHWDQILSVCQNIYNRVEGVNLIGWDFAITPDGVDLIEGNPGASYVVAQIPYVSQGIGLRSVMTDPYL